MSAEQQDKSITCPRCGWTSYNPNDVAMQYCGHCHRFFDELDEGGLDDDER
jgi:ribosomal protein L37E